MKAIIVGKSGRPRPLFLTEVQKPSIGKNEILIQVHCSTVTSGDVILRKIPKLLLNLVGLIVGFKVHKITGTEFSGTVENAGENVSQFKIGERVVGTTTGLEFGANAEYVCVPEKWKSGVVTHIPDSVNFADAAGVTVGGMTAVYLLNKTTINSETKVLIYGASGSVGTYALQLAKINGAHVTAISSGKNLDFITSLGADKVIDYTTEDFTAIPEKFDIIFDTVGKISKGKCKSILASSGTYLSVKSMTKESVDNLKFLLNLVAEKKLIVHIDKTYPLEKTPDAHKYVETGRKKGNVVITHF
jgi:NADPH:quinone reductase-like Zn-dependent oxidoreductase